MFGSAPIYDIDVKTFDGKWRQKLISKRHKGVLMSCTRVALHPFPCAEIPAGYTTKYEPRHDKTNGISVRPAKTDQPGHPPSLIRVFDVRMKKAWVLSYQLSAERRLWSDWGDAQADLSLRLAHSHFVGFIMSQLSYNLYYNPWLYLTENLMVLTIVIFHAGAAWARTSASVEQPGPNIICLVGLLYNISYKALTAGPAAHWKR